MIQTMNTAEHLATLNQIRKFSRLMDSSIRLPIIGFRIGLDPIIGLVPGVGDFVDTAFSAYLIYLATRFNLPRSILRTMIFNIALEAIAGSVPVIGDLFDAYYKSNIRNLALLEKHLQESEPDLKAADPLDLSSAKVGVDSQVLVNQGN
jgi:hypothetical protein